MSTTIRHVRTALATIVAALMVMAVVAPVGAATPQSLTLVSTTTFNDAGFNYGTFTASGAAVDNGLVCAAGTFVDTGLLFAGYQSGKAVQIQVSKTYTCPSGATFFVKMQIHAGFDGTEWFTWVVKGGTGDYASLRGSGSGTTAPNPPTGNINTFVGFLIH
jgi:hypothetical protein